MDCIFSSVASGATPSRKVMEDGEGIAFLDIFPANQGHTLVIPKKHTADIFDISSASYQCVASILK